MKIHYFWWIHHYMLEIKDQPMSKPLFKQWVGRNETSENVPKKAKPVLLDREIMAIFFFFGNCVVSIDYLEKGKLINGEYYAVSLE